MSYHNSSRITIAPNHQRYFDNYIIILMQLHYLTQNNLMQSIISAFYTRTPS